MYRTGSRYCRVGPEVIRILANSILLSGVGCDRADTCLVRRSFILLFIDRVQTLPLVQQLSIVGEIVYLHWFVETDRYAEGYWRSLFRIAVA